MRSTHTYAVMEVSQLVYNEVFNKLERAGYDHAIIKEDEDQLLVMQGIALKMVAGGVTRDEEPNIRTLSSEEQDELAAEADSADSHAIEDAEFPSAEIVLSAGAYQEITSMLRKGGHQTFATSQGVKVDISSLEIQLATPPAYVEPSTDPKLGTAFPGNEAPLALDPDGFLEDNPMNGKRGRAVNWKERLKPWAPMHETKAPYLYTTRNSRGEPATGQRVIGYRCPHCNTLHEGVIETELPRFQCLCKVAA